jgi:hypothetical protein
MSGLIREGTEDEARYFPPNPSFKTATGRQERPASSRPTAIDGTALVA